MPNTAHSIIGHTGEVEITTNRTLMNQADPNFILSATIDKTSTDPNETNVSVSGLSHAIITSATIRDGMLSGENHTSTHYFTREEVQTAGLKPGSELDRMINPDHRVLRVMPVLMLRQDDKEMLPLTLRGLGASNKDSWGCASGLAGSPITIPSMFETLNREAGILIDGRPALFVPTADLVPTDGGWDSDSKIRLIETNALKAKQKMATRVPELMHAFARGSDVVTLETSMHLPANAHTVHFHGGLMNGSLQCVAYDNPAQRTLTLLFPMVADVPKQANLTVFNGEGYPGPATLATKADLRAHCAGMPLIPGLREYIKG